MRDRAGRALAEGGRCRNGPSSWCWLNTSWHEPRTGNRLDGVFFPPPLISADNDVHENIQFDDMSLILMGVIPGFPREHRASFQSVFCAGSGTERA